MDILNFDSFVKFNTFINESKNHQEDKNNHLREAVKKLVSKVTAVIMNRYPFFGEILVNCRFLYDHPEIPIAATDGKNIYINTYAFAQMTEKHATFVICHEILHIVLLHFRRMEKKINSNPGQALAKRWNKAADYELNPMLVDEGLIGEAEIKSKYLYKDEYLNMSAETIYDKLENDNDENDDKDEDTPYPVNVGDIIRGKDGKYGRITSINVDGSFDVDELTKEEAWSALGA